MPGRQAPRGGLGQQGLDLRGRSPDRAGLPLEPVHAILGKERRLVYCQKQLEVSAVTLVALFEAVYMF